MSNPDPRRGDEPSSTPPDAQPGKGNQPSEDNDGSSFPDSDPTEPQPDDERPPGRGTLND